MAIPIGFRFHPTKEEILISYLGPAIKREPLPANVLMEIDIYGDQKQPWNLFDKDSSDTYWIFTMLKKKSGSRIDRVAGCGCWLNQSCKEIKNSGGDIGQPEFTNGSVCLALNDINEEMNLKEAEASANACDWNNFSSELEDLLSVPATNMENQMNNHDFGGFGHQGNNNPIFMDRTQTMLINSCCPQQAGDGDEAFGQPEFTTNGSVSFTVNDNIEAINLEASADACDWNKLFSELEDFSDLEDLLNECT
ncbi:No apical meristem (NAM) protein [Corchorus olitorius]|uniref:No apical meristem (NAM) protein n=1 Tax=Corchorus olitorius TaxID=93759 RepID=A0A1R3HDE0_9ROSI|nr:No apical meristem (NAM) protein [Corchorus olitorius]